MYISKMTRRRCNETSQRGNVGMEPRNETSGRREKETPEQRTYSGTSRDKNGLVVELLCGDLVSEAIGSAGETDELGAAGRLLVSGCDFGNSAGHLRLLQPMRSPSADGERLSKMTQRQKGLTRA